MARKTSRRIQPKAKPPSREELLERLARKTQERFPQYEVRPNQTNRGKMSTVLLDFLAPYMDDVDSDEAYEKLIVIGMTAWNTALLPPEKEADAIDDFAATLPTPVRQDFRNVMQEMIRRKQRFFADNRRWILDYQITDLGGQWHLSIVFTPPPEEP